MVLRVVCKGDGSLIVTVDGVLFADVFSVANFFHEAWDPDLFLQGVKAMYSDSVEDKSTELCFFDE